MVPFFVLVGSFALFGVLGALGVGHLGNWGNALRYALAAMFLLTASAHFNHLRPDLVRMVPDSFPEPGLLVTLTGVAEIAGAVGLLVRRTAAAAATGLSLLLLAVFPANVHAALAGLTLGGEPATALWPRAILQLVFLTATVSCALRFQPDRAGRRRARTPRPRQGLLEQ